MASSWVISAPTEATASKRSSPLIRKLLVGTDEAVIGSSFLGLFRYKETLTIKKTLNKQAKNSRFDKYKPDITPPLLTTTIGFILFVAKNIPHCD